MEFKLGELFCGPGGLALGALKAGFISGGERFNISHVWANDFDKDSCETFRENICPHNPKRVICKDVRELLLDEMPKIDALSFGFPCNDFSVVGKKKGLNGHYGSLYTYGVKALNYFKPKWFFAENVGGLKSSNMGRTFDQILNEFVKAGYKLTVNTYKFEEYGVPQTRHRVIIVGIRDDLNFTFRVPAPHNAAIKSCRDAIENPPIPSAALNNDLTRQSSQVIERLKNIKPGENAFTSNLPEHLKLNIKGARMSHIYKRLDPNKPAYTITGSGGGGTHVYHWKENRALTNRERARLQTFPDDYFFVGSKESVRRQIGMVVPVEGAKVIFNAILKTFAGKNYKSVEPNIGYFPGPLFL